MPDTFSAPGHKYLVDFKADDGGRFKVQLDFHSAVSNDVYGRLGFGHRNEAWIVTADPRIVVLSR